MALAPRTVCSEARFFFGLAKFTRGGRAAAFMLLGLFLAVLFHGLYDVFLFAGTVLYNLRLSDESIPFSRVRDACARVAADTFIEMTPPSGDEAYYWDCSRHPDWSTFDQPSLVIWSMIPFRVVLGETRLLGAFAEPSPQLLQAIQGKTLRGRQQDGS